MFSFNTKKILTKNEFTYRIIGYLSPSSRGLGLRPFTAATGVRLPLGTPSEDFFTPSFQPLTKLSENSFLELEFVSWKSLNCKVTTNGDVAHLVERNAGSVEVRGSIPLVSTNFLCNPLQTEGLQIKI